MEIDLFQLPTLKKRKFFLRFLKNFKIPFKPVALSEQIKQSAWICPLAPTGSPPDDFLFDFLTIPVLSVEEIGEFKGTEQFPIKECWNKGKEEIVPKSTVFDKAAILAREEQPVEPPSKTAASARVKLAKK